MVILNLALDLAGTADVKQYAPDLVLLQEPAGGAAVERLANELYGGEGGLAAGGDTAIVARGKVVPVPLLPQSQLYFSQAQVHLKTGIQVEVISLHLATPPVRVDLWSPSAWTELAGHRRKQLTQMRTIAEQVAHIPANIPVIVGGDFNAPQGDAIFRSLEPRLRDAFREGGAGWGNTHENRLPVLRIDQVWITNHLASGQSALTGRRIPTTGSWSAIHGSFLAPDLLASCHNRRFSIRDSELRMRDFGIEGMRDQGFGIRDSDQGFGIRIRDQGFGIRDQGFEIRVRDQGIRDQGFGIRDSGLGIRD